MYTIEYLPIARRDMVDIAKYIGVKLANPDAAERLAEKMAESAEDLANMPYKCPMYIPVKPLKHEYRKLIVHNYIMFYWIDEDKKLVTIARVVYSGRDYEKVLELNLNALQVKSQGIFLLLLVIAFQGKM